MLRAAFRAKGRAVAFALCADLLTVSLYTADVRRVFSLRLPQLRGGQSGHAAHCASDRRAGAFACGSINFDKTTEKPTVVSKATARSALGRK